MVVLRTLEDARTLAHVPAEDRETLALITDDARFPVGLIGTITEQGTWSPK